MIPSLRHDATDASAALDSLLASGPLPRLVWTGTVEATPERLELSGRVAATWASKVANLLVEEVDAGPGTRIALDLPVHWRTLTFALGAWLTGASVVVDDHVAAGEQDNANDGANDGDRPAPDVLVTSSLETAQRASDVELVVLVPMASFALRVPDGTPPGVLDGAADVAAQPDALGPVQRVDLDAVALETRGQRWTFGQGLQGPDRGAQRGQDSPWWGVSAVREWADGLTVTLAGPL